MTHRRISLVKSGVRIVALFILSNLTTGGLSFGFDLLLVAEALGIAEEARSQ